jgi:hypothetical protein
MHAAPPHFVPESLLNELELALLLRLTSVQHPSVATAFDPRVYVAWASSRKSRGCFFAWI